MLTIAHRWTDATFLHWRVDPDDVAPLLPAGARPDVVDGSSWLGVTAYRFARTTLPPSPFPGRLGAMTQVTVEVPTTDRFDHHAVAFLAVETQHLPGVVLARSGIGAPYRFARVGIRSTAGHRSYRSRRGPERGGSEAVAMSIDCRVADDPGPAARSASGPAGRIHAAAASTPAAGIPAAAAPTPAAGIPAADSSRGPSAPPPAVGSSGGPLDPGLELAHRDGIHLRHLGRTSWWRREHRPWDLRAAEDVVVTGTLLAELGLADVAQRRPDSAVIGDETDVSYRWGGFV